MNKTILLYILFLWGTHVSAQDYKTIPLTRSFSLSDSSSKIECKVLIQKYDLKANSDIEYFWIKNNKLQKNKGGYSGSLLHGSFLKYNKEGQLIEKGEFLTGLKNGLWQYWNVKGELVKSLSYIEGTLDGETINYFPDGSVEKIPYVNGLIHGKKMMISADSIHIEKYRQGVLIPRKVKSGFKFNQLIFWNKKKNKSNKDADKKTVQKEA